MIKNLSIPTPCYEKLDDKQAQDNGRYCGFCQKVVIDFTNKTEQEIIDYFVGNTGKKLCGTFKTTQLNQSETHSENQKNCC